MINETVPAEMIKLVNSMNPSNIGYNVKIPANLAVFAPC